MYENVLAIDEQNYWKKWISELAESNRIEWLRQQVNERHLDPLIQRDLEKAWVLSGQVRLLDVGAGPISVAGSLPVDGMYSVVRDCQDPLGAYYIGLLKSCGINPPKYVTEPTESLSKVVVGGHYNYIFCRNALDHSTDAILAIAQLNLLLAPGGIIRLRHYENEGIYANYSGLHRWNFMSIARHALVFSQTRAAHVSSMVGPDSAVIAYNNSELPGKKDDGSDRSYCEIVILKDTWDVRSPIDLGHGVSIQISDQKRAFKLCRHAESYNVDFPLFLHCITHSERIATTIVWAESEYVRTIPLITAEHNRVENIAVGQYVFEEAENHYVPKYSNEWYWELALSSV